MSAFFASYIPRTDYPGMPVDSPQTKWKGQCGAETCMQTLAINLGIVLAVGIFVGNVTELLELLIPYLIKKFKEYKEEKGGEKISLPEKEFYLSDYDEKCLLNDYMEIAILFGYMTMFVSALPGSAFVVFIALWVESKADAWKMLNLVRRPWPNGVQGNLIDQILYSSSASDS